MAGIINLNNTTPAAPSGNTNVEWQGDASTPRNVSAYLPNMVGDSGLGGTAGAVPGPAAGAAAAGKFLKADGSWAVPPSGGLAGAAVKTAGYATVAADSNTLVGMNSGSPQTITLPAAPPSANWCMFIQNIGAGVLTVNRNGLAIDTAASNLTPYTGEGLVVFTDGSNYFTEILSFNSASPITLTLLSSPPSATWNIQVQNVGAGVLTVSPNGLTLDGGSSSLTLAQTQGLYISTDGTNYFTERGLGTVSPLTTQGDILAFSTVPARQGAGANGTCLQADSTQGTGIKWALQPYDITFSYPGAPPNATVLQLMCFSRPVAMQANFAGSAGHCGGNPTSTAVYTVYKNGSPIGTVTIATSGGFTFATTGGAAQSFVAGDTLSVLTPATDATLSSVTMTFAGTR